VTSSASEGQSVNSGVPKPSAASTRLWGTAHLTAAVLFVAAFVCCAARLPGQTLDVQPLPVPLAGWLVWISGIGYLAGCAVLHAGTGVALRKIGAGHFRAIPLGELMAGALASGIVALAAGMGIGLGPQSRTYACGLETLTTVLCIAAALSAALLIVACFCRRPGERNAASLSLTRLGVLLLHLGLALVTTGGLLWLEQLPLSAAG
jgi:hypothetical protein